MGLVPARLINALIVTVSVPLEPPSLLLDEPPSPLSFLQPANAKDNASTTERQMINNFLLFFIVFPP